MRRDDIRPEISAAPHRRPGTGSGMPTKRTGKYTDDPVSMGLRKLWKDVEKEPIPDEFLALLDQIDAVSSEEKPDGDNDGDLKGAS